MSINPLGQSVQYPKLYAPELLFPIPRAEVRERIGLPKGGLPFKGYDAWRAYEISWLNEHGKPRVAAAELLFPCQSVNLIESKSLKLYLNSLNETQFKSSSDVQAVIQRDLSAIALAPVIVQLAAIGEFRELLISKPAGFCLDNLDVSPEIYTPAAGLLKFNPDCLITETVYSDLFRSNCPVTGQPDWGTATISYSGAAIDHSTLLKYLISYRQHDGFHEDCVERIFMDILRIAAPSALSVSINFLRRGGLEINPVRSNTLQDVEFPPPRFARQ